MNVRHSGPLSGHGASDGQSDRETNRRASGARRLGGQLAKIYTALLTAGILVALVIGAARGVATVVDQSGTTRLGRLLIPSEVVGSPWITVVFGGAALVTLVVMVLGNMGPVTVPRAQLLWIFPLPQDRGHLLHRAFWRMVLGSMLVCGFAGLFLGTISATTEATWGFALSIGLGVTAAGPALVALATIVQARRRPAKGNAPQRALPRLVAVLVWMGVLAQVVMASSANELFTHALLIGHPGVHVLTLGTCLVVVLLMITWARCRAGTVTWPELERSGAASMLTRAAAQTFDVQALYRALTPMRYRPRVGVSVVPRRPISAGQALLRSEILGWVRLRGALPLWTASIGAVVLLLITPGFGTVVSVGIAVSLGGLVTGDLAVAAVRVTALTPPISTACYRFPR